MSEERTQYAVHPDVAIRLQVSEAHIKQLTSTIDGMTMVMGRHADTITAQRERIAELEADIARKNGALHACDQTIAALEARLAAIPLAELERHIMGTDSAADYHAIVAYFFPQEATV